MADTIFAKILRKEIPAKIVYEDDDCLAFRDINPQAPVHILVIPRKPIPTIDEAAPQDAELLGKLLLAAAKVARAEKIDQSGYRLVVNCRAHAGQEVYHLHVHLIGGRQMMWPPG